MPEVLLELWFSIGLSIDNLFPKHPYYWALHGDYRQSITQLSLLPHILYPIKEGEL